MTTFWCSDHHLFHTKIIQFSRPQFSTVEEHNEALRENHNKVVKDTDTVWFLGDVILSVNDESAFDFLKTFNGKKKLVLGNHDTAYRIKKYVHIFDQVVAYHTIDQRDGRDAGFIVSHIPVHSSQLDERFKYCIHGHLHDKLVDDPRYVNVSMEQINFTPISTEEIREKLKQRGV